MTGSIERGDGSLVPPYLAQTLSGQCLAGNEEWEDKDEEAVVFQYVKVPRRNLPMESSHSHQAVSFRQQSPPPEVCIFTTNV